MKSDTFKDRLRVAIADESNRAFASKCDASEGTIRRYLRGEAFPPLDTLEKIAEAADVSLAWLATGEGPMRQGEYSVSAARTVKEDAALNVERFILSIGTIEEALQATGRIMRAEKKAELIAAVYDFLKDEDKVEAKDKVLRLIKTAI